LRTCDRPASLAASTREFKILLLERESNSGRYATSQYYFTAYCAWELHGGHLACRSGGSETLSSCPGIMMQVVVSTIEVYCDTLLLVRENNKRIPSRDTIVGLCPYQPVPAAGGSFAAFFHFTVRRPRSPPRVVCVCGEERVLFAGKIWLRSDSDPRVCVHVCVLRANSSASEPNMARAGSCEVL
jgi:hypothetical protein